MERIIYNRKKIELLSKAEVAREHPEWTEAKQKEVAYSDKHVNDLIKRLTIRDLAHKMLKDDNECVCDETLRIYRQKSQWIIDNIQPELINNINEYIDGNEISPIKIHNISAIDIMTKHNHGQSIHFIRAIQCMIYWKENNYQKGFCETFFERR